MHLDLVATRREITMAADAARAREYVSASKAENTRRAYRSDWNDFAAWCAARGVVALPAEPAVVGVYLAARAEKLTVATLRRRLASIAVAHRAASLPSPTTKEPVVSVMAGIARKKGTAARGMLPVLVEDLRWMLDALPQNLRGLRDRAVLLLGFATGCRRSEIVALDVHDTAFASKGMTVLLRRSKTDQLGEGRRVGVPCGRHRETCPVAAVRAWLEAAQLSEGPLFRGVDRAGRVSHKRLSAQVVRLVVKKYAEAAGLDPTNLGAHSLRSGLVTSAVIAGASELSIQRQTGHASVAMVRRYTRDADLFRGNAVSAIGL